MLALEIAVAAAVLVGVALLLSRRSDAGLPDETTDHADLGLPTDRIMRSDDVDRLRLRVVSGFWGGLRGYRFGDVDAVMDQVEETLRVHEGRTTARSTARRGKAAAEVETEEA